MQTLRLSNSEKPKFFKRTSIVQRQLRCVGSQEPYEVVSLPPRRSVAAEAGFLTTANWELGVDVIDRRRVCYIVCAACTMTWEIGGSNSLPSTGLVALFVLRSTIAEACLGHMLQDGVCTACWAVWRDGISRTGIPWARSLGL